MPRTTCRPEIAAAIDRLILTIESPRGSEPSQQLMPCGCLCTCFEEE